MTKKKKRFVLGLTGVFGSGKSTAAKFFQKKGFFLIDCDAIVRGVYQPGNPVRKKIIARFGSAVIASEAKQSRGHGLLRRVAPRNDLKQELAKIVFTNNQKRHELEKIVHPYVFKRIRQILERKKYGFIVIDMPLLFEVGFQKQVDAVLVVSAKRKVIEKRLRAKGFSPSEIKSRLGAQMSIKEKMRRADYVIINSGNLKDLRKQVVKILTKLKGE